MDFSWSEDQLQYKNAAIRFAQKELSSDVSEMDRVECFPRERWRKCAEFGVMGLPFPAVYGGAEEDILIAMLVMEGLGYGRKDNGLLFAINAQMWAVQHPISHFGTAEQKARYLPGLIRGNMIGDYGISEPDSGSDAFAMRARAEKRDGGYVLNGTKTFVTNAPVADLALVFAMTAPDKSSWGVSAFLVEKGTPGFMLGKNIEKMGLRTAPMGELLLQDYFVPAPFTGAARGMSRARYQPVAAWSGSALTPSKCIGSGNDECKQ